MTSRRGPRWWGGRNHILFTVVVFVILASLDNAAIGLLPPLYAVIARDLSVQEASVGLVTATTILVTAVVAVGWGYWGDRSSRKRLLLYGTLIWSVGLFLTGASRSFAQFLAFQIVAAVGLGCIASVGFSVVSDFVSPRRRGLAMSLWGLSQGVGMVGGSLLGGLLGASNWHLPFFIVAGAGLSFAGLYLLTYDPKRGRTEPELSQVFAAGGEYEHRAKLTDIPHLVTRRSNVWLILQGLTAQIAYGSLLWSTRLFVAKVEAAGYSLETATAVGSVFAALFQIGGLFVLLGGAIGDFWQRHDLRGVPCSAPSAFWGPYPFPYYGGQKGAGRPGKGSGVRAAPAPSRWASCMSGAEFPTSYFKKLCDTAGFSRGCLPRF